MGLGHVDHRKHREDEGLQRDDEHVEHRPAPLQHPAEQRPSTKPPPNIRAMSTKIISPAYRLPNSRSPSDSGLAISVTPSSRTG